MNHTVKISAMIVTALAALLLVPSAEAQYYGSYHSYGSHWSGSGGFGYSQSYSSSYQYSAGYGGSPCIPGPPYRPICPSPYPVPPRICPLPKVLPYHCPAGVYRSTTHIRTYHRRTYRR